MINSARDGPNSRNACRITYLKVISSFSVRASYVPFTAHHVYRIPLIREYRSVRDSTRWLQNWPNLTLLTNRRSWYSTSGLDNRLLMKNTTTTRDTNQIYWLSFMYSVSTILSYITVYGCSFRIKTIWNNSFCNFGFNLSTNDISELTNDK